MMLVDAGVDFNRFWVAFGVDPGLVLDFFLGYFCGQGFYYGGRNAEGNWMHMLRFCYAFGRFC